MPGIVTSPVEIVQVTRRGFWMAIADSELFLDFTNFPWFRNATIDAICDVQMPSPDHFYWPALDIDLDMDSIREPSRFPMVYHP